MTKILILGGGFGGIRTALDLSKRFKNHEDIQITLIDRNNYQTFFPLLYEVATAYGITHDDPYHQQLRSIISISFSDIFTGTGVEIVEGEVEKVDINEKKVITRGGKQFKFDYLVLAFGSETSTYGIPGVTEYAYKFKSVDDALMLFQGIEKIYKERDPAKLPIKHLIIGAGFAGIELAAELALCTTHIAHKHKIYVDKCTSITLVEAAPLILPMISDLERIMIKKRMGELGVEIKENTAITSIRDDHNVILNNGQVLMADFIIWTAGIKSPEFIKSISGLELNPAGRIKVNEFLQVDNQSNIFAIGDNILFINDDTQKPVPQMAFIAVEQGRVVAKNIKKLIMDQQKKSRLVKFHPPYNTWIAPVGGKHAVVHTKFLVFDGYLGWLFRELVDARYLFSILPVKKALRMIYMKFKIFIKND